MNAEVSLDDKYTATEGRVFLSGTQALVRLPMVQMRRDRLAGLNTAAFITGYRGSPLGALDMQLARAKTFLPEYDVTFQPGVNEDLAATALWGTQQVPLSEQATKDGVVGFWYGKGPGVDRSGDVFRHANAAGTSAHGGVLALAGDDHTCKSSTVPHQSDHGMISAMMPMLYPSSVQEFVEIGLLGIAISRFSGCWVGYKVIAETIETTAVVDLAGEARGFVPPEGFAMPEGGPHLRWPDVPMEQDARLHEVKLPAALAFARANRVDQVTLDSPSARFGIAASGKAYEDVWQALQELGIDDAAAQLIGLRVYKVRMPWPLEPEGALNFAQGLDEVLVVEERREMIEAQLKEVLYSAPADARPRVLGKKDDQGRVILSSSAGLTISDIAVALADRVMRLDLPEGLATQIAARRAAIAQRHEGSKAHAAPVIRVPHFCAGCPHNTSTRVPEGSKAMAGIGCHFMAGWMDRKTETFTHMGGEGVSWAGIHKYTDEPHRFVNIGDGTYFHSGSLAIRASVMYGANITYKVLFNDAVAMTGGQAVDGDLTPAQITHQLHQEGVAQIYLVSDDPDAYPKDTLAPGTIVRHRDHIDAVQRMLREVPGVTAIVYVQTCASELRRRRKRGQITDPDRRAFINAAVCEGCGDCSVQSNCIAIDPKETPMGRKRQINQSACNKDLSCVKGFCPSFVTLEGATPKKRKLATAPDFTGLPEPIQPQIDGAWNIAVTGVGGTGVLTIGALLGMAAHIEGKSPLIMDMAGLAQKGGAALSHIRIAPGDQPVFAPRLADGAADVLIAADAVVAASKEGVSVCDPNRTQAVLNAKLTPVSNFVLDRDFDFQTAAVERTVEKGVQSRDHFHNFSQIALTVLGDEIGTNMMMLGYAAQVGLVPLAIGSMEQAIRLNGVAVEANVTALNWGRLLAHDPDFVFAQVAPVPVVRQQDLSLEDLITQRMDHLTAYQNARYAARYKAKVDQVRKLGSDVLTRAVAQNLAKVMAYKDEYEVARLYSDPAFLRALKEQFDGTPKLTFHMAPPFLPGTDPNGRPKKRAFGPWMQRVFPLLAAMKRLRGTVLDPFGKTEERRIEQAFIKRYEEDIDLVLSRGDDLPEDLAHVLLSLPDQVRGFGPVKAAAMEQMQTERAKIVAQLTPPQDQPLAAE